MSPTEASRTNEVWMEHLGAGGAMQCEALADLRCAILGGLRSGLRGRPGADEMFLEDVTQEALVKILDKLDQFQGRSRFTTWAVAIAIRLAFTELRKRHWQNVSLDQMIEESGDAVFESGVTSVVEAVANAEQAALVERLHDLIESELTHLQREALLAELGGMPLEEIGRRTGRNRNAVYKITHDARRKLRSAFELAGFTGADVLSAFGG